MTVWRKQNDEWVQAQRPFVKRGTAWYPGKNLYVKRFGVWTLGYTYDTIPPNPPIVSLQIMHNRYIRVGVRLSGQGHDSTLKRIRLLVSRQEAPKSQYGSGFLQEPDAPHPREPWSEFYYNRNNPSARNYFHADSSVDVYKRYPPNPTANTDLPGDKLYHFSAWAEDIHGNWSPGTFANIFMPKKDLAGTTGRVVREARFQPNQAGTAGINFAGYAQGDLIQQESPRRNGFWFYNNQIGEAIGSMGSPTILRAQIRVTRTDDGGQPTANVNLFWHGSNTPSTPVTDVNRNDVTRVGTINKGESKWFNIPPSYFNQFNTQLKGFGLAYGIQASDYLVAAGLGTDLRCGEVNVVWEEQM